MKEIRLKEMNHCKTKADLHDQMARVLRMCEGTEVKPSDCCRFWNNLSGQTEHWADWLLSGDPSAYSFAIGILDGNPLFIGDKPYHGEYVRTIAGVEGFWIHTEEGYLVQIEELSWNPPNIAIGLIECKPAFVGDTAYTAEGVQIELTGAVGDLGRNLFGREITGGLGMNCVVDSRDLTWKPRPTDTQRLEAVKVMCKCQREGMYGYQVAGDFLTNIEFILGRDVRTTNLKSTSGDWAARKVG